MLLRKFLGLAAFAAILPVGSAVSQIGETGASATAGATLSGTVVKGGAPIAGVDVTLHRVSRDTSGAVAESVTGPEGRFSFELPPPDPTGFTVYFAAADYGSVPYYGPPIHSGDPTDGYEVAVYDTTSSLSVASQIRTVRRDVVMLPDQIGGWEVNEVVRILNPTSTTLISANAMPTWEFQIPAEATDFQAGEGEISAEQVRTMGERVMLVTPLPPGTRELFLRYRLPAGTQSMELPVSHATDSLNLFVRQPSPALEIVGLEKTDLVSVEDERFLQYSATELEAADEITIGWEDPRPALDPVLAATAVLGLSLLVGSWVAFRRRV
ncbi:MAG TPA: carboxypeptidase-like regulatory domain-containing protein [Longimicrobiaceae bacterium]|nr:carboxypeptidase-like regulatory domain-containing protein [Longimicrobiaceae bacterium]